MSKFYIIGTPIGNLEDMTFRAVRILKEVDLVLCEDTRVTKKLLDKYEIKTPTLSYHQHSKISKIEKIFDLMKEGKNLALVSDAGTPTISDPGSVLVSKIRGEFGNDVEVLVVPGPSALTSALSISGIDQTEFEFLGFLPHKKGRETLFKKIGTDEGSFVFYESPHRVIKTLTSLVDYLSADRQIFVARELTKTFEESFSGTAKEALNYYTDNHDKIRGEFVIIVKPFKK